VDGTVPFSGYLVIPEERACLGTFRKDAVVKKERNLIRVHGYRCSFPRVLVADDEPVLPVIFLYPMDQPEMAAAFTAPAAFKRQGITSYKPGFALLHIKITGRIYPDKKTGYSLPFVLGTPFFPLIDSASKSAIPNALNTASHWWWSFLPENVMCAVMPARVQRE